MSPNRSIYPFTPERPRDLSARTPEPAPSGVPILSRAPQISLGMKTEQEYQTKETLYTPTLLCLVPAQGTEVT